MNRRKLLLISAACILLVAAVVTAVIVAMFVLPSSEDNSDLGTGLTVDSGQSGLDLGLPPDDGEIDAVNDAPLDDSFVDIEQSDSDTVIERHHYEYRDDVAVIDQIPACSINKEGDAYIITFPSPNDEIRALSVGETFVFQPTAENPNGLAGRVENIKTDGEGLIITAGIPGALDEVFSEFEFAGEINLLADATDIRPSPELENLDGVEFYRNPTRLYSVRFTDVNIGGVTFNGEITMFTPRVDVDISLKGVNYFILTMAAETNVKISSELSFNRIIPLFEIPISYHGVGIDIPVGLRVNANGEGSVDCGVKVETKFGISNYKPLAQVNTTHRFDYNYSARAELSVNVQAKASVFYIPTYGMQGDFGMGARTDRAMQQRCPERKCFVYGLYHIRRISSLDWGVLSWMHDLKFSENLVPNVISSYWYVTHDTWSETCPHAGSVSAKPPDAAMPPITDPSEGGSPTAPSTFLGEPVTLDEAKKMPGLYIKEGDRFILIKPQWKHNPIWIGNTVRFYDSEVAMEIPGMDPGSHSSSAAVPLLFDMGFVPPKIPNDSQLVLIGLTNIAIYEVMDFGWTIPTGLALWDESIRNPGGWISFPASKLLSYNYGSDLSFEEINGEEPGNYIERMIYTGYLYNLYSTHGILRAQPNESFTFGWMDGTQWVEKTYVADKEFYLLPNQDHMTAIRAEYEIVETRDGYFEVVFMFPPEGLHCTGKTMGYGYEGFNNIIEFLSP